MLFRFALFAIGFLSTCVNSQVMLSNCTLCHGVVYIRTDLNGKSWTEAQEQCRKFNSTLLIIDTPDKQVCFEKCLQHFSLNPIAAYIWIGANSSGGGSDQWRWLNGSSYSDGSEIQDNNTYKSSYAFASKETSNSVVRIISSAPTEPRFYICRFPDPGNSNCINGSNQQTAYVRDIGCFVSYKETLSWFRARNQCLLKGGDLATFSNVSLLSEIIQNGKWWIGLRSVQWNWINAVSGETDDVTFAQWRDNQPDGNVSECISTDMQYNAGHVISWRDYNCSTPSSFICQVTLADSSTALPSTFSLSPPSPPTPTPLASSSSDRTSSVDAIKLGVGIGVGVGVPLLLTLIALIVFLALRHRKRRRTTSREPRSGSYPDVTQPSSSSDSPYGVVAMYTTASEEYNGNTASKAQIEYATLQIAPKSSSQNHFDSKDNNAVYSNSSQAPPVADTAHYEAVKRTRI